MRFTIKNEKRGNILESMDMMIAVISLVCGLYCLYAYVDMKRTGRINKTILLGKSIEPKKCKDKEAYLKKVTPKVLVFGLALILYSSAEFVNMYMFKNDIIVYSALGIFAIALIWFGYGTTKATKEYFE